MPHSRIRFGAFIANHAPNDESAALSIQYDLDLVELLDKLDFDEAWFGEHHSGGWEIYASPEIMIAAASQRTSRIKLGTGVVSLPYHHPFHVADRLRQIEYLCRGRTIFGFGPGALPSDAYMLGVPVSKARDRMEEGIESVVALLNGETVTKETEWFKLKEARLQLGPYNGENSPLAVASQISPTGARAAGKYGMGLLSIGATSQGGFNSLAANWKIAQDVAQDHGQVVNRSDWRLVGPVHVAETREKARENMRFGLDKWITYISKVAALPLAPPPGVDAVDHMIDSGFAVIGTPDDYVAHVDRLVQESGGFGAFLHLETPWADWAERRRSYELIARHAIPKINKLNDARLSSESWLRENNEMFRGTLQAAIKAKVDEHARDKGDENISPDILAAFEGLDSKNK
jgi:limonene 1,2-monooxygenase|tara:strand:+ start:833 stop:2044 length:1212 start_codon:yes stop_codon:yes gene_type:complete